MAPVIDRDPAAAAERSHDLVVVGGGIYGVALTLEAALRGLAPVLVERADFGSQTSWNSLRIVHGGLRYLQTLDLPRFRESVEERRQWLVRFPDLVAPLRCLMPLYNRGLRRPSVFRLALACNDLLSRRRNDGVDPDHVLPRGRVLGREQTLALCPTLEPEGLRGGALWYDGSMPDSQRLIVEMLHWAVAAGARALNYVQARELLVSTGRVAGVRAVDRRTDATWELRAPVVVNCAGPWSREVAARFDREPPELFRRSLAFNALIDRAPPSDVAVAVEPRTTGRTYFLHPWKGRILAGTYHGACPGDVAPDRVEEERVTEFLDDLNSGMPRLGLRRQDVLRLHWGLLPAREPGTARLAVRDVILDHGERGGPRGLFSVSGVKFTTARRVAERTLRRIAASGGPAGTGGPGLPRPRPTRVASRDEFARLLEDDRGAAAATIRRLVREEAVVRLDDLLLRRTDWGMDPRDGRRYAEEIATLLGWDERRRSSELEHLERAPALRG